ncbi:hypothetical protein [Propionispora sp. 2/2-37]|uniref:hypothetical protein n=1 Tax=Propionispora sp. 2/2-37 TaxID=1677858 RepID=UPI0006BB8D01|nr:hypothetical protein [Propionispora sp. 2/2-37]
MIGVIRNSLSPAKKIIIKKLDQQIIAIVEDDGCGTDRYSLKGEDTWTANHDQNRLRKQGDACS